MFDLFKLLHLIGTVFLNPNDLWVTEGGDATLKYATDLFVLREVKLLEDIFFRSLYRTTNLFMIILLSKGNIGMI